MSVEEKDALPLANGSSSEERMREIVEGNPGLQEIHFCYMQELQSLRNELASIKASRGVVESGGADSRVSRSTVRGYNSCLCAPMDPALWSTLPKELLQQIFARLPLAQIVRLRCLSTEWEWNLTSKDSEFTRACAEANPKIVAVVRGGYTQGSVAVSLHDIKTNRWHMFSEHRVADQHVETLSAGDGGLVCIVSTAKNTQETPLFIAVFNPLTRQRRLLPQHALRKLELRMVQLVMDRDTGCYKVIVVGEKKQPDAGVSGGGVVAKLYSSETGVWTSKFKTTVPDLIFGYQYCWDGMRRNQRFLEEHRLGPCAYDSAQRQLLGLDDGSDPRVPVPTGPWEDDDGLSECYALVEDHLFVLHYEKCKTIAGYCISEYRGQRCEPHWVKLKVHRCKEFDRPPYVSVYTMSLFACRGFLLVKAHNNELEMPYCHELTWLYDLSTTKWQAIPPFPGVWAHPTSDAMFELQWDAIP